MAPPLVLLGSGYTLTRLALSQAREGRTVIAATRDAARRSKLERLGLPLPPTIPLSSLHETLRGDRSVLNFRLKALGWVPRYPDFPVGFAAVLDSEGIAQPAR
ncbi:hypothetical protein [Hyalangium sp.]|uniref:hypothetical protein n=1 Tax=Hyalangium sp. TaxID=2028555 RepID=UPI002D6E6BCA|nr:hypothetical protein [Hyalangium sp.]HYH98321.1 hypothetical protein [Hyalangium sp.]